MTKLITITPAKPFNEAKTRLATILSPEQRVKLSQTLLKQSIKTALSIGPVVVVSRGYAVRCAAKQAGARAIAEIIPDLNAAISQGIAFALAERADAALVLPLDLPLLTLSELQTLVDLGMQTNPSIIIAPCRRNQGTNALLLRPPTLIAPQFGDNSFAAHQLAAQAAGVKAKIYRSPGLTHDLDTPDDWRQIAGLGFSPLTFNLAEPSNNLDAL
ncbi:MAG TPA: 2-phospho-L-lactate guanylyltransferase [Chloroflexi bacterium]|nr:2-phospho-L-lactate guanylyltransferase [Chloroflexota bacterium]